jgi:hypothetical protein
VSVMITPQIQRLGKPPVHRQNLQPKRNKKTYSKIILKN